MYGIVFKLQPNENPAQRKKSKWNYTCCEPYCYGTCIHHKFKVKDHVRRQHKEEWTRYSDPSQYIPDEEDYVPTAEGAADEIQVAGELGAEHALVSDDINQVPQEDQASLDGPTQPCSTSQAAMQVPHIFCTARLPGPVFSEASISRCLPMYTSSPL